MTPDSLIRELAKKTAKSIVDHGSIPMATLKESIILQEKVDELLAKEIDFPEVEPYPEIPEVDLSPLEEKLDELLVETKKKDLLEYDLQIDEKTRKKLKGDKGDSYVLTEQDKEEIASKVDVPIVEKVIEIKEVQVNETPEALRDKLESLEGKEQLDVDYIKGVEELVEDIVEKRVKDIKPVTKIYSSGGGRGLQSVVAGTNVTVDNTDPYNPIINATGGGGGVDSVNGATGVVVLDTGDIASVLDSRYVTDADLVTLSNTSNTNTGDQLMYGTISVAGQADLDPSGTGDTLTIVAGTNVTVTTNAGTNELTINSTATGGVNEDSFGIVVDGAGTAITTGSKGTKYIPWDCTVTGWDIRSDISGSCVFNVKRAGVSLAGTEKPTLSSSSSNSDLALSTWTTSLLTGDVVEFVVDSASTLTRATVTILVSKL